MKLTINHLAAYLPYKLQVRCDFKDGDIWTCELKALSKDEAYLDGVDWQYKINEDFKPILHPLSNFGDSDDLKKVHEFIGLGKWCEAYDNYFDIWFKYLTNIDKLILQAPYEIFQYFLSNHYDVFNLIPNNLAIDINTLNQ